LSPLERVLRSIASRAPAAGDVADEDLRARVWTILQTERHTTRSLALRLGRPRDSALYEVLSLLLQGRAIATDGESCEFYRRDER
jgi:hypothetical protein